MSTDTSTSESANRVGTVPDQENIPCVQYGFPDDEGPIRSPKLRTIFEPVPTGAITASPVYIVPRDRYEQQEDMDSGYEVEDVSSIAKELQDECEAAEEVNRVLYPIHIESDVYHDEGPETLIEWFREFVEDYLDVPFYTCTLYFSGNRSIHVHVPRFVKGEGDRERLKEQAQTFCDETGADLDLGIYSRKRLFRLPGVEHEKTGLSKVEIQSTWDRINIFRESNESNPSIPRTYADVLWRVFASQESLTSGTAQPSANEPHNLFSVLDSDKTVLTFDSKNVDAEETKIEAPLIERADDCLDNPADVPEWAMYNAKEFSPYALASGNPRSIAALKIKRGAFAREDKRNGATMIPSYFYGAVGCDGQFTKEDEHAPLQLSKRDYGKWDYEPGDTVVVIGGKSGSSRILDVEVWEATIVGHALTGEDGSREAALDYLTDQGYDVGSSGATSSRSKGSDASSRGTSSGEARSIWPARSSPKTRAEELQRKAEQEGIDTLSHNERIRVACRHLRQGWKPTWEWFREQFGSEFKPEVTWSFLRGIVEDDAFEEYDQVTVPEKPA